MRLYLLNYADDDAIGAELDDKRGAENLADFLLSPSMPHTTIEAAQAHAAKIYQNEIDEINEDSGYTEHDKLGVYELDWQVNEAGNVWNAIQPMPFSAGTSNWRFRISCLEIVT